MSASGPSGPLVFSSIAIPYHLNIHIFSHFSVYVLCFRQSFIAWFRLTYVQRSELFERKIVIHVCIQKVRQRGSTFDHIFFVDEGRVDSNITKSGPSLSRQQNTI